MRVLITGSRKGIGLFLAERFLDRGYKVFGCSRSAETLVHPDYTHYRCDVTCEKQVGRMIRQIGKDSGGIDVVINNAGIAALNHILSTPADTIDRILATNFLGTVLVAREAAKLMVRKKTHGRIINFSTVASPLNLEGEAIYASSKAAVQKFTQVAAKEFAPFNITVNCIGPTPIATDLIKAVPKGKIDELIDSQVIKRLGEKNDVLNIIDFFASKDSDFITGQTLYLGGIHD